ncbi:hypothetical protein KRE40_18370 [Elizabethkingia meningoseptica]|uniref:hypothetical protein n=1 Tax=Elizabethkingia meningoseptica TaxID=238 RepID=UPI0023B04AA8|nr:hypothetical protein [Elizabethkingia meningoseptica]MDE5510606.1 hypothetical protein [Elizabethkingia meningoseptica]
MKTIDNLTGVEIMHYTLLFCYNWTKQDFEIAFKDSRLGWDYYYNKLQGKIQSGTDPGEAIISTVLNMDNTHRPMLFNYLFGELYPDKIEKTREMHNLVEAHKKKAEEKRNNKISE